MNNITLRDLELFCEVVKQRSFSKAAKQLGISQPVASETVRALEEHLGTALINRSQRPLELTPSGQVYFEGCRNILDLYRRLEDRLLQLRDKVVGPVHIAAIYSVGLLQMDTYVKAFCKLHPEAELEIKYLHPDEVLKRVLTDDADLGLLSFPPKRPDLVIIPWQDQEMVVVVPPQHRLASRRKIQTSELQGEHMVSFTPELQIRTEIDRWLRTAKVKVSVIHEFDNIENIKRAVEVGSGFALLPLPSVRRELEIGSLRALALEDVKWQRPLAIIHRKHKVLTTAVQHFLDLLKQPAESLIRNAVASVPP